MSDQPNGNDLVEMSWDPITRIVGSLGVYTKIDFASRRVAKCHSTSSIFRGYSMFMKGKVGRRAEGATRTIKVVTAVLIILPRWSSAKLLR